MLSSVLRGFELFWIQCLEILGQRNVVLRIYLVRWHFIAWYLRSSAWEANASVSWQWFVQLRSSLWNMLEHRELSSRKHNAPSIFFFGAAKLGTTHWRVSCRTSYKNKLRACRNGSDVQGRHLQRLLWFCHHPKRKYRKRERFPVEFAYTRSGYFGGRHFSGEQKMKDGAISTLICSTRGRLTSRGRPLCVEIYNENKSRPSHHLLKKNCLLPLSAALPLHQ